MGRPWWYDSYWEKGREPKRGFRLPRRPLWLWAAIVLISLLITGGSGGFNLSLTAWVVGFLYYLCRILSIVIFVRVILSWFMVRRYNLLFTLLDDINEPILRPLRRIIPRLGMFDITPLIAIGILYVIPLILRVILS